MNKKQRNKSLLSLLRAGHRRWRNYSIIVVCMFMSAYNAVAQDLDSLERTLILNPLSVKEKIRIYDDLSWGYSSVDYLKTVEYSQKGIVLAEQDNDKRMTATFYLNTSIAYYMAGMHDSALIHFANAVETASSIGDVTLQPDIYPGNREEARAFFDKYTSMINIRANENYRKYVSETEIKYETEKKEMQITALLKQKKLYGAVTMATVTTILLLLASVFLRYRVAKQKKLIAEQKVTNLEQEKILIATQSILEGENAERARLARDLHDGLGGMLSLVKLKLQNINADEPVTQQETPPFLNALKTLDQAISELRHIAHNLMPESLTHEGLKAALTDFCNDIPQAEIHFFGTEERLEKNYRIESFRILQELVNNALKHSCATQIIVQVIIDNDRLNLIVSDNGKGFDVPETDFSKTSGLNNLKSRVNSLAGQMALQSEPGKGTEVEIEFQLNHQSQTI